MDLYASLQAFVVVGRSRSFSTAARELGVSKSVISDRVRQLEELIGRPLFFRSTRDVRLSPIGGEALEQCADLVEHIEWLVQQMSDGRCPTWSGKPLPHAPAPGMR
jgi:DNA-binding transcriptional LysR family regulator